VTLQVVPTPDSTTPFWTETVTLDGTQYILLFNFNQRCATWYLSLQTIDGDDITDGIKLVAGWDLLVKCADPNRPPGRLYVLSTTSDWSPPGLADLAPGGRCVLTYLPIADYEALP
jgi:hypothetical protein